MYSNSHRRAHRTHYVVVYQLKIIVNMAIPHDCCVACFCFVFARDYRLISSFLMHWFIFFFSSILHSFTSFPFDNYLFYLVRLLLVLFFSSNLLIQFDSLFEIEPTNYVLPLKRLDLRVSLITFSFIYFLFFLHFVKPCCL